MVVVSPTTYSFDISYCRSRVIEIVDTNRSFANVELQFLLFLTIVILLFISSHLPYLASDSDDIKSVPTVR